MGASTRPYSCRIISYADKWTRHGVGNYCNFRFADRRGWKTSRPAPKPEPWPRRFAQNRDVDGDGDSSDDSIVSIDFSLDEVFHEHNWPHCVLFPERHNGRFYGGTAVLRSNTTKFKGAIREIGINPDHSPPWWDGRAEDHPLNGGPDSSIGGNFHHHYWCVVWKKQDFMNHGDRRKVTFDDSSMLAVIFTRTYWQGYDDVRLVAMDADQLYISDNKGFDIPGPDNGPGMPGKTYGRGRVFRVCPTMVTWAKYDPHGNEIDFDADKAKFAPHEFKEVTAVGSGLSAADLADGELRLRFYTKLDLLAAPNTDRINASPAVWDGVVVVPMDNGAVYGLEALQTGKVLWTFETGKANRSSPAIAARSGLVYFGSRDGELYALDAKTGDKAWEFATGGPVDSSPWPADGAVYVGSDDGHLYALE